MMLVQCIQLGNNLTLLIMILVIAVTVTVFPVNNFGLQMNQVLNTCIVVRTFDKLKH